MEWVIGVDEAGRGPLAGPISVGVVAIPAEKNGWEFWEGLKDSKQLSEAKREAWLVRLHGMESWASDVQSRQHTKSDIGCLISCAMVGARTIDSHGIVYAARLAAARAITRLSIAPHEACVLLDKNLRVPDVWHQEEFVKGDERIPVIALASIVAKVTRDHRMQMLARAHPEYGFEVHKGYGTTRHYEALRVFGPSPVHRKSFLKSLLP